MLDRKWARAARVAVTCAAGAVTVAAGAREAHADGIPVVVLTTTTGVMGEATPKLQRIAAALSGNAELGPSLSAELRERFGRRPPSVNPLHDAGSRVDAARAAYNNAAAANDAAAMNAALEALERVAGELEAQPDVLSTFADAREQLARALLFVANTTIQLSPSRADDALRRLATMDPQRVIAARSASSAVRQAFAQRVQEVATAGLVVQSVPTGCEVFRDGRSVGTAPAQLSNLAAGTHHRISVRCGGRTSLVHPVTVAQGVTSTLTIDVQLDSALDVLESPALRYATLEAGRARWVEDLARLGTALGATRIFGLIPSEDRVIAVDVVSGSIAGESPVTDGAQLRRLAIGVGGGSSAARTTTSVGTGNGAAHTDRSGNAGPRETPGISVAPPNVGGERPPPTRPPPMREITREVRGGVPTGAFALGALGVAAVAAGPVLTGFSLGARNSAEQLGESPADMAANRPRLLQDASTFQWAAVGAYAAGGALVVTGVLVGVFGRSTTTVVERVEAMVVPSRDGAALVIGGRL